MAGTRFTKAATPQGGAALNLSNRSLGSNMRKQKLTEASGTNPSKLGGGKAGSSSGPNTSYAQNTAPHKAFDFSVGGPGYDQIQMKFPNK